MAELQFGENEFTFTAAVPESAKTLTAQQVEFFNENGYLAPIAIGDEAEAEVRREYFEHLLQLMEQERDDRDNYGILGYQTRCGGLWDLVNDNRILDVVSDLIGDNIICWSTHYFNKLPVDPKAVPLHQDASYWALSPQDTITCWLAIDASTIENACLQVLPGSHRLGHLQWEQASGPHVMEGQRDALSQSVVEASQYGDLVNIELQPGEMSIHSDKTVHGSEPNNSGKRRCGFAIRYCAPHVKPTDPEWGQNAILCRGVDEYGHFGLIRERPDGDDMTSWRSIMTARLLDKMRQESSASDE